MLSPFRFRTAALFLGFKASSLDLPNSERAKQDCAHESKGDENCKDIQLHGKVHERPPWSLTMAKV
jgi:hypothetical protein